MNYQFEKSAFIVFAVLLMCTVSAFQVQAAPTTTPGGLLTFSSQWEFEAAFPGLPMEDFEESPVGPGLGVALAEPLDITTNAPGAFSPGDIQPGLTIQSVEGGHPSDGLFVLGNGFFSNGSKAVGINWTNETMDIVFSGDDVHAVGMDLMLPIAASVTVSVYSAGNTLLDVLAPTIQATETFFCIYSTQPITHITIASVGQAELVDNIQFGTIASDLILYSGKAVFESAYPGLPQEDFEESTVADTMAEFMEEPLNSGTNNAYFSPGDILDGLSIRTVSTSMPTSSLVTVGGSFAGANNATKAIATRIATDNITISFPLYNASYAVGMDLMFKDMDRDAIIIIYNFIGKILKVTTWPVLSSNETFFGVFSNDLIGRIAVLNNSGHEFVDNVQFGGEPAGLTFYSTETDFRKVRPNLPSEDFSESPVVDNTINICNEPVDSETNQIGCFVPGDILPNISFQTQNSLQVSCPACLKAYGTNSGSLGNTTPMLAVDQPDYLEIIFTGKNIHYIGMDHYSNGLISLYGPNDTVLGSFVNDYSCAPASLDFWGVASAEPIRRITFDGGGPDPAFLNEVWFGGKFPWPSFLPAITGGAGSPEP